MKNKRGFSVVESLIVIVILIFVILICSMFVSSMLKKENKQVFKTEVIRAMQAAGSAYQIDLVNKKVNTNSKICYPVEWLKANNMLLLESKEEYNGSILIESNEDGQIINYTAWLANNDFIVNNANLTNLNIKGKAYEDGVISKKNDMQVTNTCENTDGQTLRK